MIAPNIIVSIAGDPKTGKTHLACTFPEPILLFSFDIGYEPVLRKFEKKDITVKTYEIPIIDSVKPKPYAKEIYQQFEKDYTKAIEGGKYKTIVVDTATALYELGRHYRAEELGRHEIMPYEYGEVYARLTAVLLKPRIPGINLVATHYLKEEYKGNEPTGNLILDGYRRTEGLVDIALGMRKERRTGKDKSKKTVMIATIKECRFDRDLEGQDLEDASYDDLMALLGV